MTDFIHVVSKRKIKKQTVDPGDIMRNLMGQLGGGAGGGGANNDAPPSPPVENPFEPDERWLALHTITSFKNEEPYGWIVTWMGGTSYEYLLHEDSFEALAVLRRSSENAASGLLINKMEQIITNLEILSAELQLVPRIGSQVVELQRHFDSTLNNNNE